MVLEGERVNREQSRHEVENKGLRMQLDDLRKEIIRLHMTMDHEFMAMRVCVM
jgi:hypothetical protein